MKTYYLTRDIKAPDGRIHKSGASIMTGDPDMQKWIEDQLRAAPKTIPIEKPPTKEDTPGDPY